MADTLMDKKTKKHFFSLVNDLIDVSGDKAYRKFLFFLIMIDLTCFAFVATDNLLGWNLNNNYSEFIWTFLFGLGLIVVSNIKKISKVAKEGFKSENFAGIATSVIGAFAVIAAFLSLPQINIQNPVINAVKGILAIIAIIYIVLESWVIK